MTLESYYKDYILTGTQPNKDWTDKPIHDNVIHTCQICHTNVAWNRADLTGHLASHGYSLEQYKTEYMPVYRFNSEATVHMTDDSQWADQNIYLCKVQGCGERLSSRVRLVLHIQKVDWWLCL